MIVQCRDSWAITSIGTLSTTIYAPTSFGEPCNVMVLNGRSNTVYIIKPPAVPNQQEGGSNVQLTVKYIGMEVILDALAHCPKDLTTFFSCCFLLINSQH
jgi:hypothetical protein